MKRQTVLLFNNRRFFKKRAENFIEKQLRKHKSWKNVQITFVDNFIDFTLELDDHPELVIITYNKIDENDSRFFEERILNHVRNEAPASKTVVISKNHKKLERLFGSSIMDILATGENVLQQMLSVMQQHVTVARKGHLELSERRYYKTRFGG
jgi:hypothetical protein